MAFKTLSRSPTLRNRYAAKTPPTASVRPQSARAADRSSASRYSKRTPGGQVLRRACSSMPTDPSMAVSRKGRLRRSIAFTSARVEAPEPQPEVEQLDAARSPAGSRSTSASAAERRWR